MGRKAPNITQRRSKLRRPHTQHFRLALETGPPRIADTAHAGEDSDVTRSGERHHVEPDAESSVSERSAEKNLARASGRAIE